MTSIYILCGLIGLTIGLLAGYIIGTLTAWSNYKKMLNRFVVDIEPKKKEKKD